MVWRTRQEYDRYGNMTCDQNSNTNEPYPRWAFNASTNQLSRDFSPSLGAPGRAGLQPRPSPPVVRNPA